MRLDTQLSSVLHVLLHLADAEGPMTSEVLAGAMRTNPVVLRRTLAGLRDQGYVQSEKGHGGGWTLACDLSKVTLRDVLEALGRPSLLAIGHRTERPDCLVEASVNAALETSFRDAEAVLLARLGAVTLGMLKADVRARLDATASSKGRTREASRPSPSPRRAAARGAPPGARSGRRGGAGHTGRTSGR